MQSSFSDLEYAAKKKVTRRDRFLGEIDSITPWSGSVSNTHPMEGDEIRATRKWFRERLQTALDFVFVSERGAH